MESKTETHQNLIYKLSEPNRTKILCCCDVKIYDDKFDYRAESNIFPAIGIIVKYARRSTAN